MEVFLFFQSNILFLLPTERKTGTMTNRETVYIGLLTDILLKENGKLSF